MRIDQLGDIKKCSIIVRTKNEERWISLCLEKIFQQDYKNFEVILVDNLSTDKTVEKAENFPITKVVEIQKFMPGAAINLGIRESSGDYIVCISGHCIPTNERWLSCLVAGIEKDKMYAGVYGRQEPMSFSSPSTKRDLLLVFGLDTKEQVKDGFFHNANSIFRREVWDKYPFSETATNIEDRIWGEEVISKGYKLYYEPDASVYHHHGIHHDGDVQRAKNIVRIIEEYDIRDMKKSILPEQVAIVAIVPFRESDFRQYGGAGLASCIESLKKSKYIKDIFVSTDSMEVADYSKVLGAKVPFIREKSLAEEFVDTDRVVIDTINKLEIDKRYPDLVFYLEPIFPHRQDQMIDQMIEEILISGLDTILAGRPEYGGLWKKVENNQGYERIDSGEIPHKIKESMYISSKGLGLVTYVSSLRKGSLLGANVGIHMIKSRLPFIEMRDSSLASY
jgi:rhamnosyltransferase